jgi:hypothetical protein
MNKRLVLGIAQAIAIVLACVVLTCFLFTSSVMTRIITAILILFVVLFYSFIGFWVIRRAIHERWLRRYLCDHKRWLAGSELEQRIEAERGTLIVERAHKNCRIWWTPDCIRKLCPYSPIDWFQASRRDDPFTNWCVSKYLNLQNGTAFLSEILPDRPNLCEQYPGLDEVEIPFKM